MRKQFTKLSVMAILAAMLCMLLPAGVLAAVKPSAVTKQVISYPWEDNSENEYFCKMEFKNLPQDARFVSAKSSKTNILTAFVEIDTSTGKRERVVRLYPQKPGRSTVTVTYTTKGQTKTLNQTITVVAYPNPVPVKSVEIGGKKVNVKTTSEFYRSKSIFYKKGSAKVKVSLRSGWTIVKSKSTVTTTHNGKKTTKNFTNGMTVKKTAKNDEIRITLTLKKKTLTVDYDIFF